MELKLLLTVLLIRSATVAADYIRPPPRKALHLPWHSQPSSYPQQVTLFITLYSSIKSLFLYTLLLIVYQCYSFPFFVFLCFWFSIWVFVRKEKERLTWVYFIFISKLLLTLNMQVNNVQPRRSHLKLGGMDLCLLSMISVLSFVDVIKLVGMRDSSDLT